MSPESVVHYCVGAVIEAGEMIARRALCNRNLFIDPDLAANSVDQVSCRRCKLLLKKSGLL